MKKFDVSILKDRITEKRNALGMTQAKLAETAGITPAAISQIEKGNRVPTTPVLRKIANVLGVSMDYLAGQTAESEVKDIFQDQEALTLFRGLQSLHPDDKQTILELTESLKARRKKYRNESRI